MTTRKNDAKKKKLKSYERLREEYIRLLAEQDKLEESAETITRRLSFEPKPTGVSDKIGNIISPYMDIQKLIDQKKEEMAEARQMIEWACDKLPKTLGVVMKYRYINLMKFGEIAECMHYSERHITRLHGDALNRIKI